LLVAEGNRRRGETGYGKIQLLAGFVSGQAKSRALTLLAFQLNFARGAQKSP
jgi:hypothetical protein